LVKKRQNKSSGFAKIMPRFEIKSRSYTLFT